MYFSIGNFEDNYLSSLGISPNSVSSSNEGNLYGVRFQNYIDFMYNGTLRRSNNLNTNDLKTLYQGIRLGKCKDYEFNISTNTIQGRDDFVLNNDDIFIVKDCCTTYDSDVGIQTVVSHETDTTFQTDKNSGQYDIMVEFTPFYFAKPDPFTFLISDTPRKGFTNILLNDILDKGYYSSTKNYEPRGKFYISKYALSSEYMSLPNSTNIFATHIIDESNLTSKGMYLFERYTLNMLNVLMFVKYGIFNIKDLIIPISNPTNNYSPPFPSSSSNNPHDNSRNAESILGKDGKYGNTTMKFGLVNYDNSLEYLGNYPFSVSNDVVSANGVVMYRSSYYDSSSEIQTSPRLTLYGLQIMTTSPDIFSIYKTGENISSTDIAKVSQNNLSNTDTNLVIPYAAIPSIHSDTTNVDYYCAYHYGVYVYYYAPIGNNSTSSFIRSVCYC